MEARPKCNPRMARLDCAEAGNKTCYDTCPWRVLPKIRQRCKATEAWVQPTSFGHARVESRRTPYPAIATSLNFFIFLPCHHYFPLPNHAATSSTAATALILSPLHQRAALFLPSSAIIVLAIAATSHCVVSAFTARRLPPLPRCCHLPASMPCHPFYILQWCHSPRCSFNPSSSIVACCRYHPPLISLLALLLNNCCSPHITASRFLLGRYFPLPFPFSVHHSLTLLFIAHHSSIAARTMLSASPSDAPIIVISSLLP
ncbi:hypothetical protein GW17_00043683 [Ensete ventricosum]|nr:hypothetical protein GW17_00043683 [Ensete ventricosum]